MFFVQSNMSDLRASATDINIPPQVCKFGPFGAWVFIEAMLEVPADEVYHVKQAEDIGVETRSRRKKVFQHFANEKNELYREGKKVNILQSNHFFKGKKWFKANNRD